MQRQLSPYPPRQAPQVYIDPDVPAYKVIEKRGFVDDQDHLWEKGSLIYWEGHPSMGLDPMNDLAEVAMREYLERLDGYANDVSEKNGTSHASIVNAFEARRRIADLDRKFGRSVDIEEQMPIMGAKKYEKRLARAVEAGPAPQTPIMGHAGRASVAPAQARGNARKGVQKQDPNEGRAAVNNDDKGI